MTTYYVDAINGSDSNSGQTAVQAFKSIGSLSQISLKPGDNILLARGSVFAETLTLTKSGKEGAPITVGAYGTGEPPAFSGNIGIYGTKTAHIIVKDVAFVETTGAAIYGNNVKNWVIDNVSFSNTGTLSGIGGVFFKTGSNVSLTNSKFDGVAGDGIFVMNINGLNVSNNSFTRLHGSAADAIQFTDSQNVNVNGNHIDQSTSPDTTKGGVVGNNVQNVVMRGNEIVGGSFGTSMNGQHVLIEDNKFSGHAKYGWSASILVAGNWDLQDYVISHNSFSDSRFGVSLTGLRNDNVVRNDIKITDNVFQNMERSALKIDKPSTGDFSNNVIVNSEVVIAKNEGAASQNIVGKNLQLTSEQAVEYFAPKPPVILEPVMKSPATDHATNVAPVAVNDMIKFDVAAKKISGNILENDVDANGDLLLIRTIGSQKIINGHIDLTGLYGTLSIEDSGEFTYKLYDRINAKADSLKVTDKFQYKVSDGIAQDTAALVIDLTDLVRSHAHMDIVL